MAKKGKGKYVCDAGGGNNTTMPNKGFRQRQSKLGKRSPSVKTKPRR